MDGIHPHFTVRTYFSFLLLILLQTSTEAQDICSAPIAVEFAENNRVGDVVVTITVQPGVTLEFKSPPDPDNPFILEGNTLIAAKVLDHETIKSYGAQIICTDKAIGLQLGINIVVLVTNVNDNLPVFDQEAYNVNVNEMSSVDTSVGHFPATDLDEQQIFYTLTSESNGFKLKSSTIPDLLVATPLDYDKVKNVKLILYAQDTPLEPPSSEASFTATATIMVTILDVDNRPPWFQPCTEHEMGGAVICQSAGYTSRVVLNEQETGVLPLKPAPLYAIDGDSGINEEIMYSFLSGDGDGLFKINPNSGNISMLKPADVLGTISLTVLAAQKMNSYQFATTTVTVNVQVKSLHPPQFQRPQYEGIITKVGAMAVDTKNKDQPLRIIATDDDYAATEGLNPHITYSISRSSDFSIIDGYIFMTKDVSQGTVYLQVVATDKSNDESATAQLSVEVTSGLTTTSLPLSTTDIMTTTSIGEATTNSKTTEDIVSTTSHSTSTDSSISTTIHSTTIISTTISSMSTEGSFSTTNPSLTSEESITTATTAHLPTGGYGPTEMAAVGATLGVLLFICLVVIGVLAFRFRREKADWRKIYDASMFQSSLGQGSDGHKEGMHYINDAFRKDEDGDSTGSGGPGGVNVMDGVEQRNKARNFLLNEAIVKSSAPLHALLSDDTSQAGSDKADDEKEVKPILTKERRMDEGYKSVWFKEDIDPNAKEEVVIIPDNREDDSEAEESSSGREEDEVDNPRIKPPKVSFNDVDLDSGLGVKMEDPAEDSDGDEPLNVDL
ncbi:cadherin-related family member 5 isoform X1 [Micropterus dolomieu]|uniref:cadherin-related family member 5 isoform X1 n=1 Tax=Micropterus dolomieu TaxID=147949 RepID=UPI001E8DBEC8|nr:cadherin-related family member 5 isoform X1 [Micropterus dolomieu]